MLEKQTLQAIEIMEAKAHRVNELKYREFIISFRVKGEDMPHDREDYLRAAVDEGSSFRIILEPFQPDPDFVEVEEEKPKYTVYEEFRNFCRRRGSLFYAKEKEKLEVEHLADLEKKMSKADAENKLLDRIQEITREEFMAGRSEAVEGY